VSGEQSKKKERKGRRDERIKIRGRNKWCKRIWRALGGDDQTNSKGIEN